MDSLMVIEKYRGNEEAFMKDIIVSKGANLPSRVEDVFLCFEFTSTKAKAWKMVSDSLKKIDELGDAYQTAFRSGQQWAIAALYNQKRLGDSTKDMPHGSRWKNNITAGGLGDDGKQKTLKNMGIEEHIYQDGELFARNPHILDRVIDSSVKRNRIPIKEAVRNTIRVEEYKARNKVIKKKSDDKLDNQRTQAVSDYYEAVKGYEAALDFAIIAAERGKFAPEGKNFLVKKHNKIREKMNKLEEKVNG